ncbi:hypothetical protein [Cellulosimicrobium sp. JZ28]|uniref:hypothetical protein n=1 Tax=Cellulosimicrobium sp. JZ28 TaxID=1906273 RepID=UPI00188C548A|nr:hypothetical protein [Cellulosimicrobium sp. JZ28]
MRNLLDVTSALSAVDSLWVGSYDLAVLLATEGSGFGLEDETLYLRRGSSDELELSTMWWENAQTGSGPRFDVPRPSPTYISMRSPLIVELVETYLLPTGIGATTVAFFRFALKNPGAIGQFLPSILEGWNSGMAASTRARTDRLRAREEAAQFLAERDRARRTHEIAGRVIEAGHELSDAGLEVIETQGMPEDGVEH